VFTLSNQPQTIGQVLDHSFKLYAAAFKKVLPLSFMGALLMAIPGFLAPHDASGDLAAMGDAMGQSLLWVALFLPVYFILASGLIYQMQGVAESRDVGLQEALMRGAKTLLPIIIGIILYVLILMVGFVLLIIPGIILSVSLYFWYTGVVLDNESPLQALKHSHRLVWGNWRRTLTVLSVFWIILLVVYMGFGIAVGVFMATGGASDTEGFRLVSELVAALISTVITPFIYSVMLIQYHDLKLRSEGHDLEARLAPGS